MSRYFITSTGTEIGKTLITCALTRQLIANNETVIALKPIISGWDDSDEQMDTMQIIRSMGRDVTSDDIDIISPWRFAEPLSPDMAARAEGLAIDFDQVVNFCQQAEGLADNLLIEGVGGVMVPINDDKTILDLIEALSMPAILVTGSYLGAISHTLTALNVMQGRGVEVQSLIISQSQQSVDIDEMVATINNFSDVPVQLIPRLGDEERDQFSLAIDQI